MPAPFATLFDFDDDGDGLGCSFVAGVAGSLDFDLHFVGALRQAFLDGYLAGGLGDGNLRVAAGRPCPRPCRSGA